MKISWVDQWFKYVNEKVVTHVFLYTFTDEISKITVDFDFRYNKNDLFMQTMTLSMKNRKKNFESRVNNVFLRLSKIFIIFMFIQYKKRASINSAKKNKK